MIGTYVGLPVPKEVAKVLEKAQGGLQAGDHVPPELFHVSVARLGELDDRMIGKVKLALEEVACGPFYLQVEGLGTTAGDTDRIVYAETDLPRGLKNLHDEVGRVAREAGVSLAYERYLPHIPITEFVELGEFDLKQIMGFLGRRSGLTAGPFPVTDFMLCVEREDEEGLITEVIETYPLMGRGGMIRSI